MYWRSFLRTVLLTFVALALLVYLLILFVDPYQNIPFSLPLERAPISTNQRFAYPALARDPVFDSVIIGSSTLRLVNPESLDRFTGARFANLAMNSATSYEQVRMLELFVRHHQNAKFVIIGLDDSWCRREHEVQKYTFREFPEWMFDANPWNDLLYMFNDKAVENTVRMLELVFGDRRAKYEKNGYRDFTVDFGEYNAAMVSKRLYPLGASPDSRAPRVAPSRSQSQWQYASHTLLEAALKAVPSEIRVLAVFPPLHHYYLLRSEENYRECKARIIEITARHDVGVMDYMVDSPITRNDENYWDPLHYRHHVAGKIEHDISNELLAKSRRSNRYLRY